MHDIFRKISHQISDAVGTPWAFFLAFMLVVLWAVSGPAFGFSDTWQFIINTTTTILTFLILFLIQNTQNRDAKAMHLKLDELIRTIGPARNTLADAEGMSDKELEKFEKQFQDLARHAAHVREKKKKAPSQSSTLPSTSV